MTQSVLALPCSWPEACWRNLSLAERSLTFLLLFMPGWCSGGADDSWWYYKGNQSGIALWEPMPSTLGGRAIHGEPTTWLRLPNMPTVTHSRWYQSDNEYITGTAPDLPSDAANWSWFVDTGVSVSHDSRFFRHIFRRAATGLGMVTYEQDFLSKQYEGCRALQQTPGAGRLWLKAMSDAADSENVTVQYCMALPRHLLQSASFPRVTQARASHDYGQSRKDDSEQWSGTGLSAMLYWALGILPFKDDFWSETQEPGNHYQATEADPELQTLVSSLLAGPVGPSDAIGWLNRTRVMQTCRDDGILLKPHHPAMNLDSTYTAALQSSTPTTVLNADGIPHVWGTTMSANFSAAAVPPLHHLVLFANVSSPGYDVHLRELLRNEQQLMQSYDVRAVYNEAMLAARSPPDAFLAREYYSGAMTVVNQTSPLHGRHMDKPASCASASYGVGYCTPFELWALAPLPSHPGWVLLGEAEKYIGVSGQRFTGLKAANGSLSAVVQGAPGETVNILIADCRGQEACLSLTSIQGKPVTTVECLLSSAGVALLSCGQACTCSGP